MKHKTLVVVGSGGHASVVVDAARLMNVWTSIVILDQHMNSKVLPVDELYANRRNYINHAHFIVAIGNNDDRKRLLEELISEGASIASVIHPSAVIAPTAIIEEGSCVLAGSILNPFVQIGKGVIINTKVSVDHHGVIGEYTHVAPGATLAGEVNVGSLGFIGTGATISNQINITSNVIIGAGGVVIADITKPGTYVGVPAKQIK